MGKAEPNFRPGLGAPAVVGGKAEYRDGTKTIATDTIGDDGIWKENPKIAQRAKIYDRGGEWVGEWVGLIYHYGDREDRERTQWLAAGSGDGMLVWDHNKDGRITDVTELMSEYDKDGNVAYANGFEKMKTFDKDNDGILNKSELKPLHMWVDDGDALTEAGELKTLSELGITEIRIPSNEDTMASSFVKEERTRPVKRWHRKTKIRQRG